MTETIYTIADWATSTFGNAATDIRVAVRAAEEMAECLKAITTGDMEAAKVEAADVAIVLCRLAARHNRDVTQFWSLFDGKAPAVGVPLYYAVTANFSVGAMCSFFASGMMAAGAGELKLITKNLCGMVSAIGGSLASEIEKKMAINRTRVWTLDGSGHGYHVKPHDVALLRAAEQFDFYEKSHRAKGTPEADEKADTNKEMAAMCRAALKGEMPK